MALTLKLSKSRQIMPKSRLSG